MSEIDYIIKIGGSILYSISKTQELLSKFSEMDEKCAFYVGSGAIGEEVKRVVNMNGGHIDFSKRNGFLLTSSIHRINALILCSLNASFSICYEKEVCKSLIGNNIKPILDTEGFSTVFENAESLKTDYQAALLCKYLNVKKLVIITDVNGVFPDDPKNNKSVEQIAWLSTKELAALGQASIDLETIKILEEYNMECVVIGCDAILAMQNCCYEDMKAIGTLIEVKD